MSDQVLLRDLVAIPDTVHDGDFVLTLAKGVQDKSTITDYVVTEPLAANFDKALDLIKSALDTGASRAATSTAPSAPASRTSWRCCTPSSRAIPTPEARRASPTS